MATYSFLENSGIIVPDTSDTREDVVTEYRQIFGDDFVTDDESSEGAVINAETTSRQSVARINATTANQFNPNLSGGIFVDASLALVGTERIAASFTIVTATISGVPGTTVNSGAIAQTTGGQDFRLTSSVQIPSGGNIDAVFQAVSSGPIPVGVGELNVVVSSILGWETVTNAAAGVPGRLVQSDANAINRRRFQIGRRSSSLALSVQSRVEAVENVLSTAFRENFTDMTQIIDGVTLVKNSIWVNVDGGVDTDVAAAIAESKGGGANYNGNTSAPYTDPSSQQTSTVMFQRPEEVGMLVRVTARASSAVPDPIGAITQSVLDYAAGEIAGNPGLRIGTDVSPFEISGAINTDNPGFFIIRVEVAEDEAGPTYTLDTFPISLLQVARFSEPNIQVIIQ